MENIILGALPLKQMLINLARDERIGSLWDLTETITNNQQERIILSAVSLAVLVKGNYDYLSIARTLKKKTYSRVRVMNVKELVETFNTK